MRRGMTTCIRMGSTAGRYAFGAGTAIWPRRKFGLQMEEFAQGRFGGVIIHARAGLRIPYMGDAWFAAFRTAVAQAKRLGLEIYIYDEDGWPSGFASGRIPELGDAYCFKRLEHAASNRWGDRLLAVYRGDAKAGYRRIAPAGREGGRSLFRLHHRSALCGSSVPGYGAEISRIRLRALCG